MTDGDSGGEIKNYVIGIIVFVMISAGVVAYFGELQKIDPTIMQNDSKLQSFQRSFDKLNSLEGEVEAFKGPMEQAPNLDEYDSLSALVSSSWQIIKTLPSFGISIIQSIQQNFGIPSWAMLGVVLIIITMIAFGIYGMVFNRTP